MVPESQRRAAHPIPVGWRLSISPERPTIVPDDEIQVTVVATPPPDFRGRQPININAFDDSGFVGGVTLYVEKE